MKIDNTYLIQDATPPPQSLTHLRVGAFEPKSMVAGPGCRAVLWVTGCLRRCPGCIKPEFLPFESGEWIPVAEVASKILAVGGITGVTFSGGEPFEQSLGLAELCRLIKIHGFNTLAYSGYALPALQSNPIQFGPLLEQLDWLIDGPFEAQQQGPFQYLGSANQKMWQRQSDGVFVEIKTAHQHDVQVTLGGTEIRLTGFPNKAFERSFAKALASRGISLQANPEDDPDS